MTKSFFPRLLTLGAILLLLGTETSPGIITLSIDMDTGTPGIQSTRAAAPGESFDIEILGRTDGAGVSSYSISVRHDNTELSFAAGSAESPLAIFTFNLAPGVTETADIGGGTQQGQASSFDAATFGAGPTATTFSIGTINYQVTTPNDNGAPDIIPGFFAGPDGAFDNTLPLGLDLEPTAVIEAGFIIPEPSAAMLFLLGSSFLALRRRR